jgi:hypothetical protein
LELFTCGKSKVKKKSQVLASLTQSFFLFQMSLKARHKYLSFVVHIVIVMHCYGASECELSVRVTGHSGGVRRWEWVYIIVA